jgi:hypothetical protein
LKWWSKLRPQHQTKRDTMDTILHKLKGANMDIDLITQQADISWKQDACPWNGVEKSQKHRCAVKNISICPYFQGIEYLDTVLCSYPE